MTPCINTHCSLSKHSCQRYSCTLELRNRLERRRSERDHFKARLETDAADSMRSLRKLREECGKFDKDCLQQVKQLYEDQASKTVRRPKCFCAECAVEHKDREIAFLRKKYQALQAVQQVIADVQRKRKSRPMGTSPPPCEVGTDAWKKHVRHAAVQPNGVDVKGMGIMDFLPVKDLLDREIIVERLVISGRASR